MPPEITSVGFEHDRWSRLIDSRKLPTMLQCARLKNVWVRLD